MHPFRFAVIPDRDKETDTGDANDRTLAGAAFVFDGVEADQDVRQRSGSAKQSQHQRQEVQFIDGLVATNSLEARVLSGTEDATPGRGLLKVDGRYRAVAFVDPLVFPKNDFAFLQRAEEGQRPERSGFLDVPRKAADVTNGV